jgi:DNA polymerase III epsilon subunit family exonuclease
VEDLLQRPARAVPVAVIDLEMTGLDPEHDRVCEIAVVRTEGFEVLAEYQAMVKPGIRMSTAASRVTGITDAMLEGAPRFGEIAGDVVELLAGAVVIAHNVTHDLEFLHRELDRAGVPLRPFVPVDTLLMARRLFAFPKNNLHAVCEPLGVVPEVTHRALSDARTTWGVWRRMLDVLDPDGDVTLGELIGLIDALAPNSPLRMQQQRVLRDAHRHQRTVWIEYQATDAPRGVVKREIAVWKLRLPHIQAWCYLRDGERVFRLDRIRTVEPGQRGYDIPEFEPRI